jgi:hypothetical protein
MMLSVRNVSKRNAGLRVERLLSSSAHRLYPTSTMDLLDMEEGSPIQAGIHSTWQYVVSQDFCPARSSLATIECPRDSSQGFWEKLTEANEAIRKDSHVVSHELDFIEAPERRSSFDKILLLTKHCDHSVTTGNVLTEPSLTNEGSGQALSLARRVSTFCNDETRFLPELVVVAPLRRSIQTTLLSFPQFSPHTVRSVPWICHPSATGANYDVQDLLHLQTEFTGLDYTPCYQEVEFVGDDLGASSAKAILNRANAVLTWIRSRDEKIVVGESQKHVYFPVQVSFLIFLFMTHLIVSSESAWLQALGCASNYNRASTRFQDGELRLLGLNFI